MKEFPFKTNLQIKYLTWSGEEGEMYEANEPDGREVDFCRCPRTDKTCTNVGIREVCALEDET